MASSSEHPPSYEEVARGSTLSPQASVYPPNARMPELTVYPPAAPSPDSIPRAPPAAPPPKSSCRRDMIIVLISVSLTAIIVGASVGGAMRNRKCKDDSASSSAEASALPSPRVRQLSSNGYLELEHTDGQWYPVCDATFDHRAASVACRMQTGYFGSASYTAGSSTGTTEYIYADVECDGTETSLFDCTTSDPLQSSANCLANNGVTTYCGAPIPATQTLSVCSSSSVSLLAYEGTLVNSIYTNSLDCSLDITVPPGWYANLRCNYDTESGYDYLHIDSRRFSGSGSVTVPLQDSVTIRWDTDGSVIRGYGFSCSWQLSDTPNASSACGLSASMRLLLSILALHLCLWVRL